MHEWLPNHEASASVRHIPHMMICNSDMACSCFQTVSRMGCPKGKYSRLDNFRWVTLAWISMRTGHRGISIIRVRLYL